MKQCAHSAPQAAATPAETQALFRRGFLAMLPLWSGAIPFGLAYGVGAREAGFSLLETQLMSLTLFSAAAQISVVTLRAAGAHGGEILITALALNIHLFLVGATISRQLSLDWLRRLVGGWFLTDATYAVAISQGPLRFPTLLGAGVSMYLAWNAGTASGALLGHAIPDPGQFALDFVVPLTFLSVLLPMLRTRLALLVAVVAGAATLVAASLVPLGVAILTAGIAASILAATLERSVTSGGEAAT